MKQCRRIRRSGWPSACRFGLALIPFLVAAPLGAVTTQQYDIPAGERHVGNAYVFAQRSAIAGSLEGDFLGFAETFDLTGTVSDDVQIGAGEIRVEGRIGDSLRAFAREIRVTGGIGGDLVAFAQTVILGPNAEVGGNVIVFAGRVEVEGRIHGELKMWGGTVDLSGTVDRNVQLESEIVEIDPGARIGGDLIYTGRHPLGLEGEGIVAGEVLFTPREDGSEEKRGFLAYLPWLFWIWSLAGALIVGLGTLALLPGPAAASVAAATDDTLASFGIGFLVAIVTPIATGVASLPIVTIPVTSILFVLFLIAIYLAKIPVAAWIGRGLLRLVGARHPSIPAGFLLGLVVLYLLFLIPYLGRLVWLAAAFLGFGAIILGAYRSRPESTRAGTSSSLPGAGSGE